MTTAKLAIQRYALCGIKFLHVFCNLVLMAAAALVLYLTIKARTDLGSELNLLWHYENTNVDVMLAASVLLITISALAVTSLYQLSFNVLLTVLAALLFFLLATVNYTIAIGVLADYTEKGPLFTQLRDEISRYESHPHPVDDLQSTLSCCGLTSYQDWGMMPPSCCKGEPNCVIDSPSLQSNGCFEPLRDMIIHYGWTIVIGLAFMSIIEIIAIATSYVLCQTVKISRQQKLHEASVRIPRVRSNSLRSVDPESAEAPAAKEEKPAEEGSPEADPVPDVVVKETAEAEEK